MLRFNQRQRAALGETLRQLANLTAAAFGLGHFVGSQPFSWPMFAVGSAIWTLLIAAGILLLAGGDQ